MKNSAFLFVTVMLLTSCFNPQRNCKDFQTGTFKFESYLNGELVSSTFIRNDSIEIEKFQGKVDTSSIRWINDCEYILKNMNPESMSEEKAIHMKILTTTEDGYTFEYGQVGKTRKSKGEVVKIAD